MQSVQLLSSQGRTVILISHRPGVIQVADRLVILQDGLVVANGPRDAVLAALQQQKQVGAAAASPLPAA